MSEMQDKIKKAEEAFSQGRHSDAEAMLEEVLGSEGSSLDLRMLALASRGIWRYHQRRYTEAIADLRSGLDLQPASHSEGSPNSLRAEVFLAGAMIASGEVQEGCRLGRATIKKMDSVLPPDSPALGDASFLLSQGEYALRNLEEAEALTRRAMSIWSKTKGAESMGVSTCLNNLGRIYEERGLLQTGIQFHRQAVDIRKKILGDHPETAFSLGNLGTALAANGQWQEAAKALEECISIYARAGIAQGAQIDGYRRNLDVCLEAMTSQG